MTDQTNNHKDTMGFDAFLQNTYGCGFSAIDSVIPPITYFEEKEYEYNWDSTSSLTGIISTLTMYQDTQTKTDETHRLLHSEVQYHLCSNTKSPIPSPFLNYFILVISEYAKTSYSKADKDYQEYLTETISAISELTPSKPLYVLAKEALMLYAKMALNHSELVSARGVAEPYPGSNIYQYAVLRQTQNGDYSNPFQPDYLTETVINNTKMLDFLLETHRVLMSDRTADSFAFRSFVIQTDTYLKENYFSFPSDFQYTSHFISDYIRKGYSTKDEEFVQFLESLLEVLNHKSQLNDYVYTKYLEMVYEKVLVGTKAIETHIGLARTKPETI